MNCWRQCFLIHLPQNYIKKASETQSQRVHDFQSHETVNYESCRTWNQEWWCSLGSSNLPNWLTDQSHNSQSSETEKYGHESCGTWNQKWRYWQNQQQFNWPTIRSQRAEYLHDSQARETVKIWQWVPWDPEPRMTVLVRANINLPKWLTGARAVEQSSIRRSA
jgi:hypothetical protein